MDALICRFDCSWFYSILVAYRGSPREPFGYDSKHCRNLIQPTHGAQVVGEGGMVLFFEELVERIMAEEKSWGFHAGDEVNVAHNPVLG